MLHRNRRIPLACQIFNLSTSNPVRLRMEEGCPVRRQARRVARRADLLLLPAANFRTTPHQNRKEDSAMMTLYWSPRSRSVSALWLMEETGQPYERVLTDLSTGAQTTV